VGENDRMSDRPLHQLTMSVLMTPDMANFAGNVHGGTVLKFLDQVAYACASRYAGGYVVTVSVDQVAFRQPIHVGELVTFLASVNHTGRSSMEVGIKVMTENISARTARHANSCFFTMVAMKDGSPTPVPQLQPDTPDEKQRWLEAERRKILRGRIAHGLHGATSVARPVGETS
jgi:acyl-CoA hydrolase